jgi:MraZ protein
VAISDLFRGRALNAVDAKGRVSLPAEYRSTIQTRHRRAVLEDGFDPSADDADERRRTGKVAIIVKDPDQPCLVGYENSYAREKRREIDLRHADKAGIERERAIRKDLGYFGASEDMLWDANGRVVLSPRQRAKVGIDGFVYFFARGETFEMWNPVTFYQVHLEEDPGAAEECRDFCEERGIAL